MLIQSFNLIQLKFQLLPEKILKLLIKCHHTAKIRKGVQLAIGNGLILCSFPATNAIVSGICDDPILHILITDLTIFTTGTNH